MSTDFYDDGLVHAHGWARTEPLARPDPACLRTERPDHDEGLVHSHGWACRERGAPAHR